MQGFLKIFILLLVLATDQSHAIDAMDLFENPIFVYHPQRGETSVLHFDSTKNEYLLGTRGNVRPITHRRFQRIFNDGVILYPESSFHGPYLYGLVEGSNGSTIESVQELTGFDSGSRRFFFDANFEIRMFDQGESPYVNLEELLKKLNGPYRQFPVTLSPSALQNMILETDRRQLDLEGDRQSQHGIDKAAEPVEVLTSLISVLAKHVEGQQLLGMVIQNVQNQMETEFESQNLFLNLRRAYSLASGMILQRNAAPSIDSDLPLQCQSLMFQIAKVVSLFPRSN